MQPVNANGMLVVSAIEQNTVYGLDAKSGKVVWKRVVGGHVDSPPAPYKGHALFG
jgi:outer membrane protein assembly factor BamB